MAFEQIKEQLKDRWAEISGRIQEDSTFNNLREKFEAQTPIVQRAIVGGACALFCLYMLSFPYSYYSSSQDLMEEFEENRHLISGLLHASRAAKEPSPLPAPLTSDLLRERVDSALKASQLIPDQIGQIQPLPADPSGKLAPPSVVQTGLAVQLKNLNLDQIMDVSYQLQTMSAGTKLMGVDIVQADKQDHYYNIVARVVNFGLNPAASAFAGGDSEGGGAGGGKKGKGGKGLPSEKTQAKKPSTPTDEDAE